MPLSQKQIEKLFKGWRIVEFRKEPHPLYKGWIEYTFRLEKFTLEACYKINWRDGDNIIFGDSNIPKGLLTRQGRVINNLLAVLLQKVEEEDYYG